MTEVVEGKPNSPLEDLSYLVIRISAGDPLNANTVHFGTGFFYAFIEGDNVVPTIVSNKHVLSNKAWVEFDFGSSDIASGKRQFGPPTKLRVNKGELPIIEHPDPSVDLAVIPLFPLVESLKQSGVNAHAICLRSENFPRPYLQDILLPAQPVLMVGFPNGLMDDTNNLPVVRRGSLATPFRADYKGKSDFVIDIAAFGGSSGSPVFCIFENMMPAENGDLQFAMGPQIFLMGVLHSGPQVTAQGNVVSIPVPTTSFIAETKVMMNLGYCVKAHRIEEIGTNLFAILKAS